MVKQIINRNESAQAGQRELDVLKSYFPQCFTPEGEFDIEKFKASLPDGLNVTEETSGFNFLGKSYARMLTRAHTRNLRCKAVIWPITTSSFVPQGKQT